MKTTKRIFKKLASVVAAAATVITLAVPQNFVAFAAEDNKDAKQLYYNDALFESFEEAEAACAEVREANIAQDLADGYINDKGEVVDEPKYTNGYSAADYVRKCMVERRSRIVFQLKSSANNDTLYVNELLAILDEALKETPNGNEGDYLRWHVGNVSYNADTYPNGYVKYYVEPKYISTQYQEALVTNKIESLKATTFSDWATRSDYYNTERVFRWICDNFTYDHRTSGEIHTAYGGFIGGKTVCQGYATGAYRLLKEMGVDNRVVASQTHGWNIVKLGSKYYNLDCTWGDGPEVKGMYDYRFFLVTDSGVKVADNGSGSHNRTLKGRIDYRSSSFYNQYPMASSRYQTNGTESNRVAYPNVGVGYRCQRQTYGWESKLVYNGETSGTIGQSKRLEAIQIKLNNTGSLDLGVEYKTHIQTYGWEPFWKNDGNISGTVGQSKRLEAIKIRLTGADAPMYDIYYRVHAQTYGWLGWAKNGESAGTAGQGKRLEAIQIKVVKKGVSPSGTVGYSYIEYGKSAQENTNTSGRINYSTHVQSYGWQGYVADGSLSGTYGEGKRLEAIKINLGETGISGSVQYRTHVQSYGWQAWKQNGALSGTSGQSKRLEAIQIKLTGNMAATYDVYYRVHAQTYGWLGWAKNGETAGTEGYSKRLESIQIILVKKGEGAPSPSSKPACIKR